MHKSRDSRSTHAPPPGSMLAIPLRALRRGMILLVSAMAVCHAIDVEAAYDIAFSTFEPSSYSSNDGSGYVLIAMIEDIETAASSQDYTLEDGFVAPLPDYILANGFD